MMPEMDMSYHLHVCATRPQTEGGRYLGGSRWFQLGYSYMTWGSRDTKSSEKYFLGKEEERN